MLSTRSRHLSSLCFGAVPAFGAVFLLMVSGGASVRAQSYTWDTIDPAYEQLTARSAKMGIKTQIVMGNARLSSNQAAFEDWYKKYLFPAMAQADQMGSMYSNRDSLAKDLERASDPATHQFLLNLAYDEAVKRVTGNYHPAVRYNAMLIIGNLNQVEMRRAERLPPVRLPKAFDFLWSELQKPDQLDVLRLAAMVGIERHLKLVVERPQDQPIPDATKLEVAALLKTWAAEKTPPAGRSEKIHTWIRRRAIDVLATSRQVGEALANFQTLVNIVGDNDEPLELRYAAAQALGELDYANVTGIDAVDTAQKLAALAAFALRSEDDWAKEKKKELDAANRTGGAGYPGMGGSYGGYPSSRGGLAGMADMGFGEGEGADEDYGYGGGYPGGTGSSTAKPKVMDDATLLMINARRRLKLPVHSVQLGIRGEEKKTYGAAGAAPTLGSVAQLAADDTQKATINKILTSLDALITATDAMDEGLDEMLAEVRTKARELEAILPEPIAEEEESPIENSLPGATLPGATAPGATLPGATAPDATLPGGTAPEPAKKGPAKKG